MGEGEFSPICHASHGSLINMATPLGTNVKELINEQAQAQSPESLLFS
jgi:hypothetical protein